MIKRRKRQFLFIAIGFSLGMVAYFTIGIKDNNEQPKVTYHMPELSSDSQVYTGIPAHNPAGVSEAYIRQAEPQREQAVRDSFGDDATSLDECCDEEVAELDVNSAEYKAQLDLIKRKRELSQKLIELGEREIELGELLIESVDNELSAMYSLFALMTPEQLKWAKEQVSKILPREDVEGFFDDVANAEPRTLEQIDKVIEDMLSFREFYNMMDKQLHEEFEVIKQEFADVGLNIGDVN